MKISVEHKGTKIVVDESNNETMIRYSEQNKRISDIIIVITEQIKKLYKND